MKEQAFMTRKRILITLALVVFIGLGLWLAPWAALRADAGDQKGAAQAASQERKILYWQDPMHPAYRSDKPGKAPDCGMDLVPVYEGGEKADSTVPENAVQINATKQQLIGVTYGEVEYAPATQTIRTVGKLTFDETRTARVHPKIEGWIEQVFVDFVGKEVSKGQPLITVYSPELVSSQQELFIAKRAKDYLGNNPDEQIAGNALSLYRATKERLRLWDIPDEEIERIEQSGKPVKALTLYSPINGFVLARNAFERQRVTPETELYNIADLSTMWVLADVYEYEIPKIKLGQTATMTLSYFPGRRFTGKVTYINPQLDPTTRTLKVRLEAPNPNYELKPDMFANVEFQVDYGKQLSVPEEAVLDSGSEQLVFVAHEGGYFEPRKVQLGNKVGNRWIVLSGLKPAEKIVTSGNFLIDSESRLKSAAGAMAGMGHGGGQGGGPEGGKQPSTKPAPQAPPQDHKQMQMPQQKGENEAPKAPAMDGDHSAHQQSKAEDHTQHSQPGAKPAGEHSGHEPQ